jgi:chlorobactene glucosyltransferase
MYSTSQEAVDGLSKNLFAVFGFRLLPYLFVFIWLAVLFLEPLAVLALHAIGLAPQAQAATLRVCIGLSVLLWLVPYKQLRFPVPLALLYPLTLIVNEIVGFLSLLLSLSDRLTWKERQLARPQWKWM